MNQLIVLVYCSIFLFQFVHLISETFSPQTMVLCVKKTTTWKYICHTFKFLSVLPKTHFSTEGSRPSAPYFSKVCTYGMLDSFISDDFRTTERHAQTGTMLITQTAVPSTGSSS